MYYIRRSMGSLMEFRGALNQVTADKEFKQHLPMLPPRIAEHIVEANRYFQANHELIKRLRNDFGGHVQIDYVRHATANFAPEETGKLEWSSDNGAYWSLTIDLAANIITAGLAHTLQPQTDIIAALHEAINTIAKAYHHVQNSTFALVSQFLWKRMG